jgi:hypothetical protein
MLALCQPSLFADAALAEGAPAAAPAPPPPLPPASEALRAILGGQDLSRLLALTADAADAADAAAAGNEEAYDPTAGELVVLFVAAVDGQPPVMGADVLQRSARGGLCTKGLPEEDDA